MASSYAPPSPTKLPAYKPPRMEAQRPPSPPYGQEFNENLIAPMGCELVIHNLLPSGVMKTPEEVLVHALKTISANHPDLVPVQYDFKARDVPSLCTIRLRSDISDLDNNPRPDLLDQWIQPLRSHNDSWFVDWACSAPNKERRLWVSVKGFTSSPTKEMGDKIRAELSKMSYRTSGSFVLASSSAIVINMATLDMAKKLLSQKTLDLPTISKTTLSLDGFKVIQPEWAFELAVTGIDNYDPTLSISLDGFFSKNFRDTDGSTLWHSSRVVDGVYLFSMRDWSATLRVLRAKELFQNYSAETDRLMYPRQLYDLNSSGKWSESVVKHLRTATTVVGGDLKALHREIDTIRREMRQGFEAAEHQFSTMTQNMQLLTNNVSSLQNQVQNQSYAMLTMREQHMATEEKMFLNTRYLQLKFRYEDADDEQKEAMKAEMRQITARQDELERNNKTLSDSFHGLVTATIQPPTIPSVAPVAPSLAPPPPPPSPQAPAQNFPMSNPPVSSPSKRPSAEENNTSPEKNKRLKPTSQPSRSTRQSPRTHKNLGGLVISSQPDPAEEVHDSQDEMMQDP